MYFLVSAVVDGIQNLAKYDLATKTGIDWKNLGKKFAIGITGLVREVNWNNLGQLMGNKFMIAWKIFNGMVHNLPYSEIGKAVAECLNGAMSQISLSEVADTLATGLNGAFTSLYSFSESFDWSELVDNIANGINTFVSEFKWEENGQKLEVFLDDLCKALLNIAEKVSCWNCNTLTRIMQKHPSSPDQIICSSDNICRALCHS